MTEPDTPDNYCRQIIITIWIVYVRTNFRLGLALSESLSEWLSFSVPEQSVKKSLSLNPRNIFHVRIKENFDQSFLISHAGNQSNFWNCVAHFKIWWKIASSLEIKVAWLTENKALTFRTLWQREVQIAQEALWEMRNMNILLPLWTQLLTTVRVGNVLSSHNCQWRCKG